MVCKGQFKTEAQGSLGLTPDSINIFFHGRGVLFPAQKSMLYFPLLVHTLHLLCVGGGEGREEVCFDFGKNLTMIFINID